MMIMTNCKYIYTLYMHCTYALTFLEKAWFHVQGLDVHAGLV